MGLLFYFRDAAEVEHHIVIPVIKSGGLCALVALNGCPLHLAQDFSQNPRVSPLKIVGYLISPPVNLALVHIRTLTVNWGCQSSC